MKAWLCASEAKNSLSKNFERFLTFVSEPPEPELNHEGPTPSHSLMSRFYSLSSLSFKSQKSNDTETGKIVGALSFMKNPKQCVNFDYGFS